MDLAELGIIFKTEGADAAIAKMEAFEEASDKVEKAEKRRLQAAVNFARTDEKRNTALQNQAEYMNSLAEATAKNSEQQDRLEERLGRAIASFGQAKSAVFEYDAILIGANERLSGAISKLRELEAAREKEIADTKAAAQALREEEGLLLDIARDIEHMNKVRAKASADAEIARQKELKDRQEYYDTIIRKAKEAEQAERDARHNAIIAAQDATKKAVALYTQEEEERKAAAARTAKAEKQARDNSIREAEQKTLSEIAWARKSRDEQLRIKEEIANFKSKGISNDTIKNMFGQGALDGHVKEVSSLAEKWNHVTLNTSRARSEMIVLAHEAVQGRFSRIPASMMVFAEYTDLSAVAMSGLGIAIMGTIAAMAGVSIAVVKGILEQRELQNALIMTGNYAGVTEGSLNLLAHTATAMGGSIGTAKEVILQLAASGKFTGEQIDAIVPAIVHMEDATGGGKEAVAKLVAEFKSLAVEANAHSRYSDEVSKAVLKLDNEYHFLTASVFAQIRALEAEGQTKEASKLATNEFAKITEDRAKEIYQNLGNIERGWRHIKEAIGEAWTAMKDWGRTETLQSKLEAAAKKIEDLADPTIKIGYQTINLGTEHRRNLQAEALKEYNAVVAEYMENQKKVAKQTEESRIQNEANHAVSEVTLRDQQMKADKLGLLAKAQAEYDAQLERMRAGRELDRAAGKDTSALDALLTDEAIAKHRAGLEKAHQEKTRTLREFSTIELNEQIREYNAQFAQAEKHTNKMVAISQQGYEAINATEADRFAVVRSNAKAEGEVGFALATEYVEHVNTMRQASDKALQDQLGYYAKLKDERQKTTDDIIAAEEAQATRTEQGRERKKAAIDKALADQKIFNDRIKDLEDAAKERAENNAAKIESDTYKTLNADMNAVIMSLEKKVRKEQEHLKTLTMSKEQAALLAAQEDEALSTKLEGSIAALEAAKAQAEGDSELVRIYQQQIDKIAKIIELRNKSKKLNEDISVAQREFDRIKAVEEAWKRGWEATNKLGMDVFTTWVEGGQDMAKKIGDALKKALAEAIYTYTLKPIVLDLYVSVMGGGGKAGQKVRDGMGLETGDGSILSQIGNGKTAYDLWSGGFASIGRSVSGIGNLFGSTSMSAFGSGMGLSMEAATAAADSYIAAAAEITATNAELAATYTATAEAITAGSTAATSATSVLAAIPVWGWVAMAALASVAGGPKIDKVGDGMVANLVAGGKSNAAIRTDYVEDHHGVFGIGSFTTHNSSWADAPDALNQGLNASVAAIVATTKAYAEAIGLSADAVDGFTKQINIDLTNLDAAAQEKAITDALVGYANDMVQAAYGDTLNALAKEGEAATDTLKRVATEFIGVNAAFDSLGQAAFALSSAGVSAASNLIAAMGGIEAAQQQLAAYQQNYFTSIEQRRMTAEGISTTLADAGLNYSADQILAGTRMDGRLAIEAAQRAMTADPSNAQAQKQYVALMKVSSAYASLNPTIDEHNKALADQQKAAQQAAQAIGGGGGGGGGGGSGGLVNALQSLVDAIYDEVNRIRGLIAGESVIGFEESKYNFSVATELARGGNQEALKALPKLSQDMLRIAEANATSLIELNYLRSMTAASLMTTAAMNGGSGVLPSFDVGTDYVPYNMTAKIHMGEKIVPAAFNKTESSNNSDLIMVIEGLDSRLVDVTISLQSVQKNIQTIKDITEKSDTIGPAPARAVA